MRAVVIAAAVAVAMLPLWQVYQSWYFALAMLAGLLLGNLIAVVSSRRSWSVLTSVIWVILGYLLVSVPVAVPSQSLWGFLPTPQGLWSSLSGIVLSWKQLVTIMPPVGSYEALLVPTFLIAYLGSLLTVSATLRWRTGWKANLAPLGVLLVLGLSIWLGIPSGFAAIAISVGVFVLIALWFASERAGASPATLRSLGVIALAVAVATAVVYFTPQLNREVWRNQIATPFILRENTSPLSAYRSYITGDTATASMLSATGLSAGDGLSLATLDSYNGVLYYVGGSTADFTKLPEALPQNNDSYTLVTAHITIDGLAGAWVPLPGELGKISFSSSSASNSFYYSRLAGSGALVQGLSSGETYTATGYAPRWVSAQQLAELSPGDADVPAPEEVPQGLDAFIATNSRTSNSAGERLQQSLSALLAQGYVSHGGPDEPLSASGHGSNRLTTLFATSPIVGDAEQYSATAALMATQAGFPARVVMGFIAPEGTSPSSQVSFLGADMTAWIEISTTQGWVSFNPNPEVRPIPEQQPEDPNEVAFPETAVDPPSEPQSQELNDAPAEATEEEPPAAPDALLQTVLAVVSATAWSMLVLGLLCSPLMVIASVKRRRRKKRMQADTAGQQVLGAWDEIRDVLIDSGVDSTSSDTRLEIASEIGIPAVDSVAVQADTAQFSPDTVGEFEAVDAWSQVRSVEKEIASRSTRRDKLRTKFSLASLGLTWSSFKQRFRLRR